MLEFCSAQMAILERGIFDRFVLEMKGVVASSAPRVRPTLSEFETEALVRSALAEASAQGFSLRGSMRLYLQLWLGFGAGVLADPLHQWAARTLAATRQEPEMARAEALYAAMLAAHQAIHGPDALWTRLALKRLLSWVRDDPQPRPEHWPRTALDMMWVLHPEKAEWAGEPALAALADRAEEESVARGLVGSSSSDVEMTRARILAVALTYAFGAGCFDDPLYPWIARSLRKPEGETASEATVPAFRAARLEKRAVTWLTHVVEASQAAGFQP